MKAIMNNAMNRYHYAQQHYSFFLRQEESAFVLHAKHTGVCSAFLKG